MPNYTFRCKECGTEYTVSCSFCNIDHQVCPKCQSGQKERLFTKVNVAGVAGGQSCSCHEGGCGSCGGGCGH